MIGVIGLGFVGLTTALGLSHKGFRVFGYDCSPDKTRSLQSGSPAFHEPQLPEMLQRYGGASFSLVETSADLVNQCSIIFFCVGTPAAANGHADLSLLFAAIDSVLGVLERTRYVTFVIKSTVPPGTTRNRIQPFIESRGFICGQHIGLINNPEFLREGHAWDDFTEPDRIVIGADHPLAAAPLEKLYQVFGAPIFTVSLNEAEFIKYLSNTLLATMISFSNEQSMIAHAIGNINIAEAFDIVHRDKRWGDHRSTMKSYVYPGCGFGGYCLPKDTLALSACARDMGIVPRLLDAVLAINADIKTFASQQVALHMSPAQTIGILGLAFKPGTDDVRDTPAAAIIATLLENDYSNIVAYDPLAMDNFDREYHLPIRYVENLETIIQLADCLVITTSWNEFPSAVRDIAKPVFDFRYYIKKNKPNDLG